MRSFLRVFLTAVMAHTAGAQAAPLNVTARLPVPVRTASIFGQRWAYYEAGPASAPVVVLIPSLGWDAQAWAPNFLTLARDFHVIAIDPLGMGRSAKPLIDYKMGTWTDGFSELLRQRRIARAAFVGAVMGGALAVQMALDHPTQVSAIVVAGSNTGPGPHVGGVNSPPSGLTLDGTRAGLDEVFYDTTRVTDAVVRTRLAARLAAGDGYTIQRHLADHRPPYSTAELSRIAVPAAFIWCQEDRTTPPSWGADYARAVPGGQLLTLERCGHFPNLETPAAFNAALSGFLSRVLKT